MTDNEIKEALECCAESKCNKCVYYGNKDFCIANNIPAVIDLINRLQAQNEKVIKENGLVSILYEQEQAENENLQGLIVEYNGEFAKQEAEIERLRKTEPLSEFKARIQVDNMIVCANSLGEWLEFCDNLKAEAYKEFAERLKEKYKHNTTSITSLVTLFDNINNILKEMTEKGR